MADDLCERFEQTVLTFSTTYVFETIQDCLHLGYVAVYSGRCCRISEGTRSSEKSVHLQQITLHHIPEGRFVCSHHPENREYHNLQAGDGRYMTQRSCEAL